MPEASAVPTPARAAKSLPWRTVAKATSAIAGVVLLGILIVRPAPMVPDYSSVNENCEKAVRASETFENLSPDIIARWHARRMEICVYNSPGYMKANYEGALAARRSTNVAYSILTAILLFLASPLGGIIQRAWERTSWSPRLQAYRVAHAAKRAAAVREQQAANKKAAAAYAQRVEEEQRKLDEKHRVLAAVRARFPADRFPILPANMQAQGSSPNLSESVEKCAEILSSYPAAPTTDSERRNGEALFWMRQVEITTKATGDLYPKQDILDYFESNEKWILRTYYAACGIYVETFFGAKLIKLSNEYDAAYAAYEGMLNTSFTGNRTWDTSLAKNRQKEERRKETLHKAEAYQNGYRQHMERWGAWYFSQVEAARKAMEPDDHRAFRPSDEL